MEIVRKVEIEDIWDEEEKILYLTGAKEFISDVNKNNPEPESEPRPERIKTRRSSGRLSKNDIIIEPVETTNEPKIVNEEVVKYFETNKIFFIAENLIYVFRLCSRVERRKKIGK